MATTEHRATLAEFDSKFKGRTVAGNEYEQSKTYETVGPVTQQFVVSGAKDE